MDSTQNMHVKTYPTHVHDLETMFYLMNNKLITLQKKKLINKIYTFREGQILFCDFQYHNEEVILCF